MTTERVYESAAQTAKRVREILKSKWPKTKFYVRSSNYSGGCSVHVSWTDGPMEKEAEGAAGWLASAGFDAMIDLKYSAPPLVMTKEGPKLVDGADYVFFARTRSEAWTKALEASCAARYSEWNKESPTNTFISGIGPMYHRWMQDEEIRLAGLGILAPSLQKKGA